ncbi:MAG: transglutaminase domain-containing protein [Betaproteobacteria bacterium]|nr:transglutaminase domain-containing protein [Betaproteobacteria bacterium]
MSFPPVLLGAAAAFWGWQTGHPLIGALLGACLEAPKVVTARVDLRDVDYERIADLCSVALAVLAVAMFATLGATRGVLGAVQWLPLAVAPIALAQRFGQAQGIRLSALFYSVRRYVRRDPSAPNRLVDVSGPYAALMVVAAGTANARGPAYYAGVVALFAWGLFALRPRHGRVAVFAVLLGGAAGAGYLAQDGLNRLQDSLEGLFDEWLVELPSDAERVETRIGAIGRIKQHDIVALRLLAPASASERLKLLHAASFNEYRDGTWLARPPAAAVRATPPGSREEVQIVLRLQRGANLLPLPAGTSEVWGVPDLPAKVPGLGAVSIRAPGGSLRYGARFGEGDGWYAPPAPQELALPEPERQTLEQLARELGLTGAAPSQAIAALREHFGRFTYSTWREKPVASGKTALEDFLLDARAGHCEYFAAATTLLLRAAGIPARYSTGYAVIEYSALEKAWLVRARHAHAWSRAYVDGRWIDVDLTPPSWVEAEAELKPPWEAIEDFARWVAFAFGEASDATRSTLLVGIAVALAGFLGWRILRERTLVRGAGPQAQAHKLPGEDSEFFAVERAAAGWLRPRSAWEPLGAWCAEAAARLDGERRKLFLELAELHQRYRFDPAGLAPEERAALRRGSLALVGGSEVRDDQ